MKLYVDSEFGKLKTVLMNKGEQIVKNKYLPEYTDQYGSSMTDELKYHPETAEVDIDLAKRQHQNFLSILRDRNIEIIYSKEVPGATDQIFTRDIGFTIGDTFFYSNLGDDIRKIEQQGIKHLSDHFQKYEKLDQGIIEGGDVFVYNKTIFVGITKNSTNWSGFYFLKEKLQSKNYQCIPIRCKENVLHLDCRFNIIAKDCATLYEKDLHPEDVKVLKKYFKKFILVNEHELNSLGSNFFVISPTEIVVDNRNKEMIKQLRREGFEVIDLDYSEITKMWGAFRCTTLPLRREKIL